MFKHVNSQEDISQTNFMISKHKGDIFLCDVVNLHLERAEPHNETLETGNGGQKGFLP